MFRAIENSSNLLVFEALHEFRLCRFLNVQFEDFKFVDIVRSICSYAKVFRFDMLGLFSLLLVKDF